MFTKFLRTCGIPLCCLLLGAVGGYYFSRISSATPALTECFTPGENCTQFIVDAIKSTQSELLIEAYGYTSPEILEAVAEVHKKGRTVRVILDKINEQPRYKGATYTKDHGIEVLIDHTVSIAHNKVMVIDGKYVINGSFNFTVAAQKHNAENVLLTKDAPHVAARYRANWFKRARVSSPFTGVKENAHHLKEDDDD